jgi:predicted ABC-type ATPase
MNYPTLILIRGLPGSGKSFLAGSLVKLIGGDKVEVLDPDATDYESQAYKDLSQSLTSEGVDKKFHPYRFLRARAHQAITDEKIIIWTQAFTNLDGFTKTIDNLTAYANEYNKKLPIVIVEVNIDSEIAKTRVKNRAKSGGHDVTSEAFERFINDYSSFANLGYKTVIVNGTDDVTKSADLVIKSID